MFDLAKQHVQDQRPHAHLVLPVLLLGALLLVASCNTMEGAGEDMEAAGGGMSDTAEDAEDEM